ncbi:MAG: M1 family metallopeptidase [Pyrinomonadaceae bacterium]|nr:M1 family metallopeptidase [Pyrinomonadaceae bacterium]
MTFSKLRSFVLFTFLFLLFSISAFAQNTTKNFNRPRTFDAQHYILRISFDRANKTVFGDTTVQLKPLSDNFNTVQLDAVGLKFESVKLEPDNQDLSYKTDKDSVIVTLDKAYSKDDLISIRFKYSATPKKGIYFVDKKVEDGETVNDAQIWTQGEAQESRHWFPSFDSPNDKATTEELITVEKGLTVIGNGEFLGKEVTADGKETHHYKMPVPHSIYLTSFIAGNFAKQTDSYKNIPLTYYVYPGRESIIPQAYGKTKDMFRVFEELTKVDFPYNKYDQTIVANFNFGGMENITATTMADTEIMMAGFAFAKDGVEDLVSHELAHSWFGNLVTCKNWSELWLNEGFATFMEAAYREKMYGRANYLQKINSDALQFITSDAVSRNRHALFNTKADPNDDGLFDTTTYQKGGAVIHILRETVGDEAFWKAINIYLNRHKFDNVETPDLQKAMEEASGQNLGWFFKQWVYGAGSPKLNVKPIYNAKTKTLNLTVDQLQKLDNITPSAFILPMEIELKTAKGLKKEDIKIMKRQEIISLKVDSKPNSIKFDPNDKIPLKTVKIQPIIAN